MLTDNKVLPEYPNSLKMGSQNFSSRISGVFNQLFSYICVVYRGCLETYIALFQSSILRTVLYGFWEVFGVLLSFFFAVCYRFLAPSKFFFA